jgi:uncharacterized protein
LSSGLRSSKIRPPSMVAYLAAAHAGLKREDTARELLNELIKRSDEGEKGVNIYIVHVFNALNDVTSAKSWLLKAKKTNDIDLIWYRVDPLLKGIREKLGNDLNDSTVTDFDSAEKHIMALLDEKMPKLQYHNIAHIYDVLNAALVIASHEQLSADEIKLLRLAALYHDAGFIHSPKNHEEQVTAITNMILATRIPQTPTNLLDKVLCDADLDYLGREDFYEIGGRLLEELKAQGVVETEREWNLVQKTFLESHRYHTRFGKENRELKKHQHIQEIIAKFKR